MTDRKELVPFYHALAEQYFSKKYALETFERRFMECTPPFIPGNPDAPLQFLRLANSAHIERLEAQDMELLSRLYETIAQNTAETGSTYSLNSDAENVGGVSPGEILDFLQRTALSVMTENPESDAQFMFFEDIYGRGFQPANALVFIFHDRVGFDADGRIDKTAEDRKARIFRNVKQQFEELAQRKTNTVLRLVRI